MDIEALKNEPTILVVDDEELMREVVAIMIEENGGSVIEAADGLEAVKKFKENTATIKCVVMDFSMPELNGYEAYCQMKEIDASVPVILASGLDVTPEVGALVEKEEVSFLSKPFHEEELIAALKHTIEGG